MVRIILKLIVFLSLSVFSFQIAIGQTEEKIKTNEVFLRESIQGFLEKTFTDFPKGYPQLIFVRPESENSANWVLEEELTSYLTSRQFSVALHQEEFKSNKFENCWELFYRIIELRLEYPKVKSKSFFGKKFVTRKSDLNLSFRLMEKDTGKILWAKRENHTSSDVIPKKTIPLIKNEQYSFLSPNLPESTTGKYVEPAIVAAVVGGLVYLFFASR